MGESRAWRIYPHKLKPLASPSTTLKITDQDTAPEHARVPPGERVGERYLAWKFLQALETVHMSNVCGGRHHDNRNQGCLVCESAPEHCFVILHIVHCEELVHLHADQGDQKR